jgi:hypothetical protein
MPDDDGYRGLLSWPWDALVFGGIAILAMVAIASGVVVWLIS